VADYDTLYVLGSWHRLQVGIWNQYEDGPFPGDQNRGLWVPGVERSLRAIGGGQFRAVLDRYNTTHSVSPRALEWIVGRATRATRQSTARRYPNR
jgi:hypothetical protein